MVSRARAEAAPPTSPSGALVARHSAGIRSGDVVRVDDDEGKLAPLAPPGVLAARLCTASAWRRKRIEQYALPTLPNRPFGCAYPKLAGMTEVGDAAASADTDPSRLFDVASRRQLICVDHY